MAVINNNINNQVGSSNSGATNTLTVDNASNTGSSNALINITVGGTSAGDAFQTFTVAGTTNWSQGVDNSDSDAYVLAASTALGTTNIMRAQTTGEINYPLQPAFLVQLASTALNVVGNVGTPYKILFDTEVFDQNGDYDAVTNHRFTAPVTGLYQFSSCANLQELTAAMVEGDIRVLGVSLNRIFLGNEYSLGVVRTVAGTANLATMTFSALMDMDAGDTLAINITVDGGAGATADVIGGTSGSFFGGYLVC